MKPFVLFAAGAALLAFFAFSLAQNQPARPAAGAPAPQAALRITFGERQDRETDYSGSLTLSDGRVTELIPWRFFGEDRLDGVNAWKLFLRRANMENQPDQPRPLSNLGQTPNIVPKGVSAVLDAPATADTPLGTARRLHLPSGCLARRPRAPVRRGRCHRAVRAGARPNHRGAPAQCNRGA